MSNEAPTDALRLVPVEPTEEMLNAAIEGFPRSHPSVFPIIYRYMIDAAPASPPAYVRTPNEDDRLRRALYRLLERHGAGSDPLSVIGSLWDTLDQGECTDLIEDWLITGKVIQVEGDIDEMLASIPKAAPASPLPGGGWQDISTAPKDEGVKVMAFDGTKVGEAVLYGEWEESNDFEDAVLRWRWANDSCSCCWGKAEPQPTHWMPLPAAPTGDA